jgi:DNA-binding GntR family transcriptional regulator
MDSNMRDNPLLKTVMAAIAEQTSENNAYISEINLAEKISISRTRLRETLQTLSAFGIIEKRQKLGVTLKPITIESVQETYELREILESQAIKNAINHITAEDIIKLRNFEKTIELATQMNDWNMAAQYDLKFHQTIIDLSQQPLLKRILDNLHLIENSFAKGVAVEAEKTGTWHPNQLNPYSHHAIVDALEQGDKKCISLLKKHIAWIKEKELKELRKKNLN